MIRFFLTSHVILVLFSISPFQVAFQQFQLIVSYKCLCKFAWYSIVLLPTKFNNIITK